MVPWEVAEGMMAKICQLLSWGLDSGLLNPLEECPPPKLRLTQAHPLQKRRFQRPRQVDQPAEASRLELTREKGRENPDKPHWEPWAKSEGWGWGCNPKRRMGDWREFRGG